MPTYEYYCAANRQTVEVMHGMSRSVSTWAELCELAHNQSTNPAVRTCHQDHLWNLPRIMFNG